MPIKRWFFAFSAIALAACASAPAGPGAADQIIAAERAFAADGYATGVKSSFLKWSAQDAVMLSPGPVNAHETLSAQPDEALDGPHLIWWPLYAGIARSGDLGFTTGPYAVDENRRGHYFTVWRKAADGGWKWVFDAGLGTDAAAEAAQGAPAAIMPVAVRGSASPADALAEVTALEAALADRARVDFADAYDEFLTPQSRIHSARVAPATAPRTHLSALAARPSAVALATIGGGASNAGDLVWTYGEGRWTDANGERTGHYARIWRKQAEGWRIAFDEFIPPRDPPATPATDSSAAPANAAPAEQ